MCVIVYGHKDTLSKKLDMRKMLECMAVSNPDGVGILLKNGSKIDVLKDVDPWALIDSKDVIKDIKNSDTFVIHFRLATHGTVSLSNVHPFQIGEDSYLVHNGCLSYLGDDHQSDTYQLADILKELSPVSRYRLLNTLVQSGNGKFLTVSPDSLVTYGQFEKYLGVYVSNLYWLPRKKYPVKTKAYKPFTYSEYMEERDQRLYDWLPKKTKGNA